MISSLLVISREGLAFSASRDRGQATIARLAAISDRVSNTSHWPTAGAVQPQRVTLVPGTVVGGNPSTGTVILSPGATAPSSGSARATPRTPFSHHTCSYPRARPAQLTVETKCLTTPSVHWSVKRGDANGIHNWCAFAVVVGSNSTLCHRPM